MSVAQEALSCPSPCLCLTLHAFDGPMAAQAEFTGAEENHQLEVFLKI